MDFLKLDISKATSFLAPDSLTFYEKKVKDQHQVLVSGKGKGNDFLGWLRLPSGMAPEMIQQIREDADRLADFSQLLIVIGIGGSYLGARAVIEALSHPFNMLLPGRKKPFSSRPSRLLLPRKKMPVPSPVYLNRELPGIR